MRVDSLDLNDSNRNDIFECISRKFKLTRSNPAQLVTDTVGRHSSGEESVPQVLSTCITVSRHRHCYCAVMSFSTVSSSCLCGCVRLASHLCLVFSSSSPPFILPLLFVLDEKASPGAPEDDGKLSVGPVWLTLPRLLLCLSLFLCRCIRATSVSPAILWRRHVHCYL